eukprot:1089188-Amphidinium_carterae.1
MDPEHVLWLNARLREMTLGQFLRWVDATIPKSVLFTSFGPSGLVVLHELSKAAGSFDVILKTGPGMLVCQLRQIHKQDFAK